MMKKILAIILMLSVVMFVGCSAEKIEPSKVEVGLKSQSETINPSYYEGGFDYKYENLRQLELTSEKDVLVFKLGNNSIKEITVNEDYYKHEDGGDYLGKASHKISKNADGEFVLPVKRQGNIKEEEAIYIFGIAGGDFVFKVIFPLLKDK